MAAAKVTKKAATTTTKAATAKTAETKKPVVKKKAPVVKQEPKKEEVVVEEKKKLTLKQKFLIGLGALGAIGGAIALHGRSKYNEGAADQAATDIQAYSQKPTEVNVYLTDNQATEEPDEIEELEEADEIEEI